MLLPRAMTVRLMMLPSASGSVRYRPTVFGGTGAVGRCMRKRRSPGVEVEMVGSSHPRACIAALLIHEICDAMPPRGSRADAMPRPGRSLMSSFAGQAVRAAWPRLAHDQLLAALQCRRVAFAMIALCRQRGKRSLVPGCNAGSTAFARARIDATGPTSIDGASPSATACDAASGSQLVT
jgi:hypothetical protein